MNSSRLIIGPVLIVLALGLFWLDVQLQKPGMILYGLLVLVYPLASIELASMAKLKGMPANAWIMCLAAIALAGTMYLCDDVRALPTMIVLTFMVSILWHCRKAQPAGAIGAAGVTLLGAIYLGVLGGFYLIMCKEHSAWVVLAVILITKMGDSGAYFTGHAMGKHKLILWLSPGKTWEGFIGAMVWAAAFAALFAWIGRYMTPAHEFNIAGAALGGVLLAIIGHAGDLTMSLFKRDAGIKDSGALLPGFGGVLDILDSILLTAPAAYWMLHLL